MAVERVGAYGFTLRNLEDATDWLVPSPKHWPTITIRQTDEAGSSESQIDENHAVIPLTDGRTLRVDRAAHSIRFTGPEKLPNHALIHPYLAPAASVLANWEGWITFHAGAFEHEGHAWLVTADRNGGKSTTLAAMSEMGYRILSDDLIVLRDGMALAGPRSLDLREEGEFGNVEDLGVVGQRRRWRMKLGPISPEIPLAGVIKLSWSESARIRAVAAEERAEQLSSALAIPVGPKSMLTVLSTLTFLVDRPSGSIDETVDLVEKVIRDQ